MINYTKFSNITYIVVRIEFNILILTIKLNLLDTEIRNSKLFDGLEWEGIGGSP